MDKFKINKLFDNANIRWLDFASIKLCFLSNNCEQNRQSLSGLRMLNNFSKLNSSYTRCSQFYLIASTRRLRAPNSLFVPEMSDLIYSTWELPPKSFTWAPSRQWPTVDGTNKCSFFIYERKWNKIFKEKFYLFFRQFTTVSNRDESNCSNSGESECPPIVDKSTIECPQIEALCLWLVYLRLRLPECHPNWRV